MGRDRREAAVFGKMVIVSDSGRIGEEHRVVGTSL